MAATIAKAYGWDSTRMKETHRLGSLAAEGQANTWRTFTSCYVRADGSGYVRVARDGVTLHRFDFGPEEVPQMRRCWHSEACGPHTWACLQLDLRWAAEQNAIYRASPEGRAAYNARRRADYARKRDRRQEVRA